MNERISQDTLFTFVWILQAPKVLINRSIIKGQQEMSELFSLANEFQSAVFVNGQYVHQRWKSHPNLRAKIEQSQSDIFVSLDEKIWALKTNSRTRPKCTCNSLTKFVNITVGYRTFCGKVCAAQSIDTKEKIRLTNSERWGGHFTQNKEWLHAFVQRCKANGSYTKMQQSFTREYGVTNRFALPSVKEAIVKTNVSKYGVSNPMQNDTVRQRMKATCLSRFGVEHPMQDPEIFSRCQEGLAKSRYALKSITMPSGAIRKVQGYEPFVIDYYLQAGISEEDLVTDRIAVPVITYIFDGKARRYFPDIFIKSHHLLVEVKSTYTWQKDIDKNIAKHLAAVDAGYHHSIIIWDARQNRIHTII